jgi:hypothetical protein
MVNFSDYLLFIDDDKRQILFFKGGTPSDVMTLLRQSDTVNYTNMLADLEAATSALKSSIWYIMQNYY